MARRLEQYRDRRHAGQILAQRMLDRGPPPDALLALPRGGVPVAEPISETLHIPTEVLLVRKLGVPSHPELAMGAIAEGGVRVLNDRVLRAYRITESTVEEVEEQERRELVRRRSLYRGCFDPAEYVDKNITVVDDGLATGATMRAAVQAVELMGAAEISVAVPVAALDVIDWFESSGFPCICPLIPDNLRGVGEWYEDFEQVSDEEVTRILDRLDRTTKRSETGVDVSLKA